MHSQTPAGTCIKCKASLRLSKAQTPERENSPKDSEKEGLDDWEYPADHFEKVMLEHCANPPESTKNDTGEHPQYPSENFAKDSLEHYKGSLDNSEKESFEHLKYYPENSNKETSERHEQPQSAATDNCAEVPQSALHTNCEESKKNGKAAHCGLSGTWSPPLSIERGCTSNTDRRSPCVLRTLEPSAGVGRELRQDLGHHGNFQSKVELMVEDGKLLLERPGHKHVEVRWKIYDYCTESSSQSISDERSHSGLPRSIGRRYESCRSQDSQLVCLTGRLTRGGDSRIGSGSAEPTIVSRPCISPPIMQDLNTPQDSELPWDDCLSSDRKWTHTRYNSHLWIAESVDLQTPFLRPGASGPANAMLCSRTPCHSLEEPTIDPMFLSESAARADFSQTPPESIGSLELESLISQLDLGNCLQALSLARMHRHATLEESALRVMSNNYLQVLQDPELYERLKADDRYQIQNLRMKGKRYLVVADMDPQDWMGARSTMPWSCEFMISSGLYYYDDYKDTWHRMCTLPKEVLSRGCAVCTMDNYLFVAIGRQGADCDVKPSRKVFCYNPATDTWKEICPMNEARSLCKLVALQGHVYAIGGEGLYTMERYDPQTDRWTFVAPLPSDTFAGAHRAAACNGELFVLGGTLRYTLMRYNPKTDAWRRSLIMGSKESITELVAVKNFLYRFDVSPSQGISVHRYHAVARLWYQCCSKPIPYCPDFQCATVDDDVYCVSHEFTMRLLADEVSPAFNAEELKVLSMAKGVLFPFVLVLPDKRTHQTRV
ncbi:hypothetical protein AAFF_G00159310 [Aldrovandia affinis]|uniref:Kelch domain-containing protein 7A n=1 Tax=Aldrovandia affinis TaxID=143900 RepID=A0AAD7RN85_9TELE|nr:hypothetical protein AAFF_G00159310 [Aldrovandia affinis]